MNREFSCTIHYRFTLLLIDCMYFLNIKGLHDLWGYQVYLAPKNGHTGHFQCVQINSKVKHLLLQRNVK